MSVNPTLVSLALQAVRPKPTLLEKSAVVPPGGGAPPPGADPMAAGGAPPGDPAMGGMPPGDPAMMGMPPGGAMPGMPPGMPPGGAMPTDPMGQQMAMGGMPGAAPQKVKPEQMMQMLDFRMYNLQQQMTAIMNALQIDLPPGALVLPPGSTVAPPAEAALPGGPQDPTQTAGGSSSGESAISPIEPMQGASPELAAGGGDAAGGGQKMAAQQAPAQPVAETVAEWVEKFSKPQSRNPDASRNS